MKKESTENQVVLHPAIKEWLKDFKITRDPNYTDEYIPPTDPASLEGLNAMIDFFKKNGVPFKD